jgi:hypothetical protein
MARIGQRGQHRDVEMPPTGPHAPGCYYVNNATGTIQRQCNPILAAGLGQIGFVGENNEPAGFGPAFPTFEAAKAFASSHITPGHAAGQTANNLFHGLDLESILLRVGEVLLGIVLIGVGIAKITGATNLVASAVKAKV